MTRTTRTALLFVLILLAPSVAAAQDETLETLRRKNKWLRKVNRELNARVSKHRTELDRQVRAQKARLKALELKRSQLARDNKRLEERTKYLELRRQGLKERLRRLRREHTLELERILPLLQRPRPEPGAKTEQAKLLTRVVSVSFDRCSVQEVFAFLHDITGYAYGLAKPVAELRDQLEFSFCARDAPLWVVLTLVASQHPTLAWRLDAKKRQVVFERKARRYKPVSAAWWEPERLDLRFGTGARAVRGKTVSVHYVVRGPKGEVVSDSRRRKQPLRFVLGKRRTRHHLWECGVEGMRVGGRRKLFVRRGVLDDEHTGQGCKECEPALKLLVGRRLSFEVEVELLRVE